LKRSYPPCYQDESRKTNSNKSTNYSFPFALFKRQSTLSIDKKVASQQTISPPKITQSQQIMKIEESIAIGKVRS
jgi:hypothetical protein